MEYSEYGLETIHNDLLNLLKSFDSLCRNNNILYSLYAGSLLGAVREKGFIPWDDDVDVIMVYEEYVKLQSIIKGNNEYYIDTEDAWVPRFRRKSQTNGAFIDLFWLTNAPAGKMAFTCKITRLKILQGMLKKYKSERELSAKYKILMFGARTLGSLFPRAFLLRRYKAISLKDENKMTKLFSIPNAAFSYLKYTFDKQKYGKDYDDIDFEDMKAMTIRSWDYVLKTVYGTDYMTPPPKKDRVRTHANQIKI